MCTAHGLKYMNAYLLKHFLLSPAPFYCLHSDVSSCLPCSPQTQLKDQQSTNGIIHNGVRVSEVLLAHGDSITFGGARSTALGSRPGPQVSNSNTDCPTMVIN